MRAEQLVQLSCSPLVAPAKPTAKVTSERITSERVAARTLKRLDAAADKWLVPPYKRGRSHDYGRFWRHMERAKDEDGRTLYKEVDQEDIDEYEQLGRVVSDEWRT